MAMIPRPLLDSLLGRRCMLFVGSGLSNAAGYPTWPELVNLLIEEAGQTYPEKASSLRSFAIEQKNPLLVAEYARSKLGPQRYGNFLRGIFGKQRKPQATHKSIANTAYKAVITTNYDRLIETAVTFERGYAPAVFSFDSLPDLGSALYEGSFFVFKLHGDVSSANAIVLTSQDYDRLILRSPFVRSFLQAIFLNFTLLFVGYSLTDPDFQLVLKELHLIFQGTTPPHYALLPDPHEFTTEHLMSQLNIQVISYSSKKNHKEAADFLSEMQKLAPVVSSELI